MRSKEVRVRDHLVRYKVTGAGEPVVLVHGLSGSSRWWRRNIPVLAEHHRVYLVDLPGFGSMRRLRRYFVLAEAATWLRDWMLAVGLRQVNLIGHSMGGYISICLAAAHPELARRLVLIAPAGIPHGRTLLGYLPALAWSARYMPPRFFPILVTDALRTGPVTLLHTARDLLAQDAREQLKRIAAPTLLIWGAHDTLVPLRIATALRQEIAGSRFLLVPRAGHVAMFDRPRECNDAILAFLAGEPVGE